MLFSAIYPGYGRPRRRPPRIRDSEREGGADVVGAVGRIRLSCSGPRRAAPKSLRGAQEAQSGNRKGVKTNLSKAPGRNSAKVCHGELRKETALFQTPLCFLRPELGGVGFGCVGRGLLGDESELPLLFLVLVERFLVVRRAPLPTKLRIQSVRVIDPYFRALQNGSSFY